MVLLLMYKKKKSVIVESPQLTKKMISSGKKNISNNTIQITELFRILVQVSIGNEMDLKPFWNLRCKENSKHLWLPTEIDYADSLSNSFNGSLKQITSNSWFSMNQFVPLNKNCQKTYCQSYTCSLADKWANGGIKKNKSIGTYKIKINPTIDQQVILNKWINSSRYTYNKTIHKIENEKQKVNFYKIRNQIVPKNKIRSSERWLLDTPKDIRANSVKEAVTMYKSAFSNLKNRNIKYFKMGYRNKKKLQMESISIPKSAVQPSDDNKHIYLYKRYLKDPIKLTKEKLPLIETEIKLLHNKRCNYWYLCIPINYNIKTENQGDIVSIDPGVKTFQTLYDPTGKVIQIGSNDMKTTLVSLYKKIDKYKSLLTRSNKRRKRNIIKRIKFYYNKFNNLISEIHNKTCRFIYLNYNNVLISNIGPIKSERKTCNRQLLSWSHGLFIKKLTHHMHKNGKKINIVTEEFTSKTCGNCGWLYNDLSNKDIYKCNSCNLKISRDVNGARNILLKHLM